MFFTSEVIGTALRLLEAEESKMKDLNKALSQGEKSGLEKNFDSKAHLKKISQQVLMKTLPFVISKKAVSDLEEIWLYTFEKWFKQQADRYYILIFNEINDICKNV